MPRSKRGFDSRHLLQIAADNPRSSRSQGPCSTSLSPSVVCRSGADGSHGSLVRSRRGFDSLERLQRNGSSRRVVATDLFRKEVQRVRFPPAAPLVVDCARQALLMHGPCTSDSPVKIRGRDPSLRGVRSTEGHGIGGPAMRVQIPHAPGLSMYLGFLRPEVDPGLRVLTEFVAMWRKGSVPAC